MNYVYTKNVKFNEINFYKDILKINDSENLKITLKMIAMMILVIKIRQFPDIIYSFCLAFYPL